MAAENGRIGSDLNPHSLARTGRGKGLGYSAQWFNFVSFLGVDVSLELAGMRGVYTGPMTLRHPSCGPLFRPILPGFSPLAAISATRPTSELTVSSASAWSDASERT